MMDKPDITLKSMSDKAILGKIAEYVKFHRLDQNKTQQELADEAGVNRTTVSDFEQGKRSNTITLIQLFRALDKLEVLSKFKIERVVSPLALAKLKQQERQRARKTRKRRLRKIRTGND